MLLALNDGEDAMGGSLKKTDGQLYVLWMSLGRVPLLFCILYDLL